VARRGRSTRLSSRQQSRLSRNHERGGRRVGVSLDKRTLLNRPGWITGLAQQLYPDTDAIHGSENGRLDVAHRTERRLPAHPGELATILLNKMMFNQLGDVSTSSYRDQINVFRKSTIWKQTAGQCGAAEKHNSIREVPAQRSQ
jgi:hypothetical protein